MTGAALRLLLIAVALYLGLLAALFASQRRLMYFPTRLHGPAAAYGLADTESFSLNVSDGGTIDVWYRPAATDKPLFLYFHGNGGSLLMRAAWLRALSADGSGFLAIDYSGYGGSTGTPSERSLLRDGEAAYAKARALGTAPGRIVLLGESLGTAVAVFVAAHHPVRALVLDSAFSSTADIAAARYWMFPVRVLMKDKFESASWIGRVAAPKLFLHATDDPVTPLVFARRLYDAAPAPKSFVEVPGSGHMVLWRNDSLARMKAWLEALPSAAVSLSPGRRP